MSKRLARAVCTLCLFVGLFTAHADDGWRITDRTDEGYEVASRDVAGQQVPTMRGRGLLTGDILHVLAVLLDAARTTEWAEGVTGTKVLAQEGVVVTLLQTFIDLQWPVSDRDAITRAKLVVLKKDEEYKLVMNAEPKALPEQDGVVRIKHSYAHFHLRKQADGKLWIEYVVDVDPGGKLPKWLIRWASKSVPGDTLRKLQGQVEKTRGQYGTVISKLKSLS
jgi:SHS2 domain-containing protein